MITVTLGPEEKYYFIPRIVFASTGTECINSSDPTGFNGVFVRLAFTSVDGRSQLTNTVPSNLGMTPNGYDSGEGCFGNWSSPLRLATFEEDFEAFCGAYDTTWEPSLADFTFTAPDGIQYKFDSSGKLVSRTDRNENKLTYSSTGITYSHASVSGSTKAVTFTRDGSSRITAIYDPISPSPTGPAAVLYAYDGSGNLSTVQRLVNRASSTYETTTYGYTNASYTHHITQITGSCCSTDVRNEYDSIGRLVRQYDGLGNVSWFAFDLTGRQYYVTNRLGPFQSRFSTSRGFCKAT